MECKILEVLDSMTYIPVLAVLLEPEIEAEEYHLGRAGFRGGVFVLLYKLQTNQAHWDPANWAANRTLLVAHEHIGRNWAELHSGDVVDVEYLLGETPAPRKSQREPHGD